MISGINKVMPSINANISSIGSVKDISSAENTKPSIFEKSPEIKDESANIAEKKKKDEEAKEAEKQKKKEDSANFMKKLTELLTALAENAKERQQQQAANQNAQPTPDNSQVANKVQPTQNTQNDDAGNKQAALSGKFKELMDSLTNLISSPENKDKIDNPETAQAKNDTGISTNDTNVSKHIKPQTCSLIA